MTTWGRLRYRRDYGLTALPRHAQAAEMRDNFLYIACLKHESIRHWPNDCAMNRKCGRCYTTSHSRGVEVSLQPACAGARAGTITHRNKAPCYNCPKSECITKTYYSELIHACKEVSS